jgi:tripartite-type tricarboxylate transporter receptor subunit TctC
VIKFLAQAFQEGMKSPEYQKLAEKTMMNLRPGFLGPEDFARFLDTEFTLYNNEMRKIGLVK